MTEMINALNIFTKPTSQMIKGPVKKWENDKDIFLQACQKLLMPRSFLKATFEMIKAHF